MRTPPSLAGGCRGPRTRRQVSVLTWLCAWALAPALLAQELDRDGRRWVTKTLRTLSLEEKIGQLILPRAGGEFRNAADPEAVELLAGVRAGRIGGAVVFAGDPLSTATIIGRLQSAARVPLLFAADYEHGAAMRLSGASRFPRAMAMGAGATVADLQLQAEITAREALAVGVHLVLAPVLDLATDGANPVIGVRSYGAEPQRVSALGSTLISTLQQEGVLATAKHFPGHGATAEDSHLGLARLDLDRRRLEAVELAPFRSAIAAGVAAVMPGHIAAPALDGRADRPATLSPEILQGLLRDELGFNGLIVSDALEMAGAREASWDGAVAVEAIAAGVDLLLAPPHPEVAWDALRRAVLSGELAQGRLDASVRRVLEAKARVGLHRRTEIDLQSLEQDLGSPSLAVELERLAAQALTWVEIDRQRLPFDSSSPPRLLLVDYVGSGWRSVDPRPLLDELRRRAREVTHLPLSPESVLGQVGRLLDLAARADAVVVAHYARRSEWSGESISTGGAASLPGVLEALAERGRPVVLVAAADPWVLLDTETAAGRLAVYDSSENAQRAVARALFGEVAVAGRLPVELTPDWPIGHALAVPAAGELAREGDPAQVGMSPMGLEEVARVVEEGIENGAMPGAVALVARRGQVVLERAFGRLSYEPEAVPVTLDTLWDLASLTKVVATTTVAMILVERGQLELERAVVDYVPQFDGDGSESVTVADLLAHSSGMLWWTDLYRRHSSPRMGAVPRQQAWRDYVAEIVGLKLENTPRSKTVYSDLGILLLGEVIERVSGRDYGSLVHGELLAPLGMERTMFRPGRELRSSIAPTEIDRDWRRRLVHGEVHDENAFGLSGVAPHAGLFSTAGDLARFCQLLLNGGFFAGRRLLNGATIERFVRRADLIAGSSRALGWDTPSDPSSAGRYFSASSFGHTGFTGTSIWIDRERELFAILLTNRVHPTRDNRELLELRPRFHEAVMQAITDQEVGQR